MAKVLITGTSRGLGKALAVEMNRRGCKVIASARNINDLDRLDVYKKITLDVTDDHQIKNVLKETGNIDILINNAAYTAGGPIEVIPIRNKKRI